MVCLARTSAISFSGEATRGAAIRTYRDAIVDFDIHHDTTMVRDDGMI